MSMIDRCKFIHNLSCEQVSDRIAELEEENAKLRQERDHWHVEQVHAYGNWEDAHKRSSELESENAKLREQIHWLKKGDVLHVLTDQELADQQRHEREVQTSINALFDENTKLRELLADTLIDPRDYCAKYGIDYDGWNSANDDIDRRMRELGIEVES